MVNEVEDDSDHSAQPANSPAAHNNTTLQMTVPARPCTPSSSM
jgi:hypothetical protein